MKRTVKNYDIFRGHAWYTPGVRGMFWLLAMLAFGAILGNILSFILGAMLGQGFLLSYGTLIAYPIMFVPAFISVGYRSRNNALFETGYALDSNHFGKYGAIPCAVLVVIATFSAGFMTDVLSYFMPPAPDWLKKALESVTKGNFWTNFLCVSIFAPLCEEWFCRGMVLRGLLYAKNEDGSRKMTAVSAIALSSVFFAVIHANPWQAIPAFVLGCLFGYVYYRTGSLKMTMLMHFSNNTLSLLLSRTSAFGEAENWIDVLPRLQYIAVFALCTVMLILIVRSFSRIELQSEYGNCDTVE